MVKIPMTSAGAEKLREELQYLKSVVRPQIVSAIAEARAHGDLRENAEYHAAKHQQGLTEGRIQDIEYKLSRSEVIDISAITNDGRIVFGCIMTLINLDNDQNVTYQIVGEDEADLKTNKISITSPIARALIGKRAGDVVEVQAPGGIISYEVASVKYPNS